MGEHDGPLSRFYSQSASAVWDYILSPKSIQKIEQLPVTSDPLNLHLRPLYEMTVNTGKRATYRE